MTKRGVSVWRRQSQFFPALDFALKPFVHALKPISHHGEDGIVGRRLSASHEFFGGMAIALADTVTRLLDARNVASLEISGKLPASLP